MVAKDSALGPLIVDDTALALRTAVEQLNAVSTKLLVRCCGRGLLRCGTALTLPGVRGRVYAPASVLGRACASGPG